MAALTVFGILSLESGVDIHKDTGLVDENEAIYYHSITLAATDETAQQRIDRYRLVAVHICDAAVARLQTQDSRVGRLTERARFLRGQVARSGSLVGATLVAPPLLEPTVEPVVIDAGDGEGGTIDLSGYTTDAEFNAHADDDDAHHVQPDLPAHEAAADSHDNGIYGRIRLHDRGVIPGEDATHVDIRNNHHGPRCYPARWRHAVAVLTLEQARDADCGLGRIR